MIFTVVDSFGISKKHYRTAEDSKIDIVLKP